MAKKYTMKMTCPQCGCTDLTVLTEEEIKAKYGDDPKFRMVKEKTRFHFSVSTL